MNLPFSRSPIVKLMLVGVLALLLQIPVFSVRALIAERHARAAEAESSITAQWGDAQTLAPAYLHAEVDVVHATQGQIAARRERQQHLLFPDSTEINAVLAPELRHRGLYEVPVYVADVTVRARFRAEAVAAFLDALPAGADARLRFALADRVGVRSLEDARTGDAPASFEPAGVDFGELAAFAAPIPADARTNGLILEYRLGVAGAREFRALPLARDAALQVRSAWPDPSFVGSSLPVAREIAADGFTARWRSSGLNRALPQHAVFDVSPPDGQRGSAYATTMADAVGVALYQTADIYQQSERSAKYALLMFALVLLALFLFEVITQRPLHSVQYGFIGLALALFYLMLLALSEHIGFVAGYGIAAAATIVLTGSYARAVLGSARHALALAALQAVAYAQFFLLVRSADHALLLGALTLFIGLALAMYLTRHVRWGGDARAVTT